MSLSWKRPTDIEFPSIWFEFEATDVDGSTVVKYRVQDLPPNRYEEVLHFMTTQHFTEEALWLAKDVLSDEISLRELKQNRINLLNQNITLACIKDGTEEIVGLNIVGIVTKDDSTKPHGFKGRAISEILNSKMYLQKTYFNPYEYYSVDKVMYGYGLNINRKYRGKGIATQLLKGRLVLGKAIGVHVTSTVFSSLPAQKAAKKAGYETNFVKEYEHLGAENKDSLFPGINEKFLKIMSIKF